MSHAHAIAPQQRPGTVTAGALLTWIGAGLLVSIGLLLVIADVTEASRLTWALTAVLGIGESGPGAITLLTLGLVLLGVGVLLVLLAVAAFTGSRAGLIALTIAAGLYVLLALAALSYDYSSPVLLFGIIWVGSVAALFWYRRSWFAGGGQKGADVALPTESDDDRHPGGAAEPDPRPGGVIAGAAMMWLAGAATLYFGLWLMWSDYAAYLSADPEPFLLGLGLHLGLIIAAVGAVFLVLTTVTFRGSRDALVALTALSVICAFLLLTPSLSGAGQTVAAIMWLLAAVILLWSARAWYRRQGR